MDRRSFSAGLMMSGLAGMAMTPVLAADPESKPVSGTVVCRLSRGRYDPTQHDEVVKRLTEGGATLIPALKRLSGLLGYYVGADRKTGTMINASVWQSLHDAEQMTTLSEMLAQRDVFVAAGVQFDPIVNYETLWRL